MPTGDIQSLFLEQIKKKLSPNVSFADSLAEILNVSRDSAYRRIRGETILSLDETRMLSNRFNISLDALFGNTAEFVTFRHLILNHTPETFERWLEAMHVNLEMMADFTGKKQIVFTAKDVPIFHYFNYPKLSSFKMFFWMKSLLNYPEFQHINYASEIVPAKHILLSQSISGLYNKIPSAEIWADETTNVTLKQLEFYKESGFFNSQNEITEILDDYAILIDDLRKKAVAGSKQEDIEYVLYKNEILIADNTVLFRMEDKCITYISHNITELLMTTHDGFCAQTETFVKNLQSRSVLISTTGEKERNKFFNKIHGKISEARSRLC